MTITAAQVFKKVQTDLQDPDGIRWPLDELARHFNSTQVDIVQKRPDTKSRTVEFSPTAPGSLHTLPATELVFLDITGNETGKKRNITRVEKSQLDAVDPAWQSARPTTEIEHFCFRQEEPRYFYTYPPASMQARIGLNAAPYPTNIPESPSTVSGVMDLPDWCELAMVYGILARAYSKDAEFGGNSALAAKNETLFSAALSAQLQSATAVVSTT